MLRIMPRISSFPPEVKSFDEYVEGCDNFVSVTTNRLDELRGNSLLVVQSSFISILTNSYYGGSKIKALHQAKGEFTATEQRIIQIITDGMNRAMENAWKDLFVTSFESLSREENIQFVSFVDGGDTVIVCSFMVQMPDSEPASFDILYPLQTLKPISSQLRSRVQNEFVQDDRSWKEKLEQAVLSINLPLSAELTTSRANLGRLMKSTVGDTFPISMPENVTIRVSGEPVYKAEIGKLGGNAAVSMTKRISLKKEKENG
jgi:flagellar motor switch protein FliM